MTTQKRVLLNFFLAAGLLLAAWKASAEVVNRSTDLISPFGSYRDLRAQNALEVGIEPTAPDTPANSATSATTVWGDLRVTDGPSRFEERLIVDGDTLRVLPYNYWGGLHWVNVGFAAPEALPISELSDLNINGDIWTRRYFHVANRFEEKRLYLGTTDPATPPVWGDLGALQDGAVWRPVYFKANNKLVLNGRAGGAVGNVIIGTDQNDVAYDPSQKLFVKGNAVANAWVNTSSREAKTDIRPLTPDEYAGSLRTIAATPLYHFRYKDWDPVTEVRTGPMAEETPRQLLSPSGKVLATGDVIGHLLAAIKELARQNDELERQITRLESERGGVR